MEKIKPIEFRNTRKNVNSTYQIEKSHKNSATTELSNFIENCKLTSATDLESLYKFNIPKTYIQEINQKLPEIDKKTIQYLSLGVMSLEYAYGTNREISNLCIDCKVKYNPEITIETTQHLIECSNIGKQLIAEVKPMIEEMKEFVYKRLSKTSYCKTIQDCKYFMSRKIYTDEIDLLLGIGKI